jgi:ubiquinone/menaquinone biosynthesis C-methylase UbiE
MKIEEAYKIWSDIYDTNENKTRDLEAVSLRTTLNEKRFENCLEIGCGTGKNTEWLIKISNNVLAVDFSFEMLSKAKQKIDSENVEFVQADITGEWLFTKNLKFDLVTCSLVLEHIEDLDLIFKKLSSTVQSNGVVYIGELHPFKQYSGSKAKFETSEGIQEVTSFKHHISDFFKTALKYNFDLINVEEYFDDNDRTNIPRILTLVFKKK